MICIPYISIIFLMDFYMFGNQLCYGYLLLGVKKKTERLFVNILTTPEIQGGNMLTTEYKLNNW